MAQILGAIGLPSAQAEKAEPGKQQQQASPISLGESFSFCGLQQKQIDAGGAMSWRPTIIFHLHLPDSGWWSTMSSR
jgi:hypothetical protein